MSIQDDIRWMREPVLAEYEQAYERAIGRDEFPAMVPHWGDALAMIRQEMQNRRVFRQEPSAWSGFGVPLEVAPF